MSPGKYAQQLYNLCVCTHARTYTFENIVVYVQSDLIYIFMTTQILLFERVHKCVKYRFYDVVHYHISHVSKRMPLYIYFFCDTMLVSAPLRVRLNPARSGIFYNAAAMFLWWTF